MATKRALRTVAFFRLVGATADGPIQFDHQDWQAFLGKVASMPLLARTHTSPVRRLIGEVLIVDEDYALKIMEPRDENSWLEILKKSGSAEVVDEDTLGTLVETSIVAFLNAKNLFGIIRGSTSSPTHAAVAEWVDHLKIDGKTLLNSKKAHIAAEPALSRRQKQQLDRSDGVTEASMRVSTSKAGALEQAGSKLMGKTLRRVKETYGDIVVTVTLRIPRGKANDEARRTLKEETQKWQSVEPQAEAVTATLVHYDDEAKAHAEKVNFVAQRISIQRGVPLQDEAGDPIRNASAVRAILSAAADLATDLESVD